ncbi:MAG: hypothetical protein AAF518_26000, partial [Spirochaetota bacterium]
MICRCNHASHQEIHTKATPPVKRIKRGILTDNFPDCHSAKKAEVHMCSCKSKQGARKYSRYCKQTIFFPVYDSYLQITPFFVVFLSEKKLLFDSC